MTQANETAAPARRYCVDCRFFIPALSGMKQAGMCGAPKAVSLDPARFVSPELDMPPTAAGMRSYGGCGVDAKWFEPKPAEQVAA
ncbi:MAG TPA: hypothetical protein VG897_13110 [Terriglobales bacterium]|nr:hypothetical protein [Terriglobales bacterium]